MFGRRRDSEQGARPSLSTINSDDGQGHYDNRPIKRVDVTTLSTSTSSSPETTPIKTSTSNSPRRKNTNRSSDLGRSDILTSPPPLARLPSVQTRYMTMLLHLDEIPRIYNILCSLFTWIILAGFLVVPGTFTTFKQSDAFKEADDDDSNEVAHAIVHTVANIGLLWLSGAFCLVGVVGCLCLCLRWRRNYVWLVNRVFL